MAQTERGPTQSLWPYLVLPLLSGVLLRWATACGPYSGEGKPPMFGDYEAQRHWMEITYALPIEQWYVNGSTNDLQYWGLDYPPLTAYHSWMLGALSNQINQSWVKLHDSHGHESYQHKLFMRYSVLLVDLLLCVPAILFYVTRIQRTNSNEKMKAYFLTTWILYPGLVLIDYGHFQYNCVSLGLFLWAVIGIMQNHDLLASIMFILALSYKQMELYHALPFFCYLFGNCIRQRSLFHGCIKLTKLTVTVLATFTIVWFPFLLDFHLLAQVLHRLFPFARGIFEDKVANVWCSLSVLIKWRKYLEIQQLVYLCASTTVLCLVPMIILLIYAPTKRNFKLSLIISSLVFFLFSFQVHEKSILLVAIPMLLIIHDEPFAAAWFLLTSIISLYPLCIKDKTQLAFFGWFLIYYPWICDFLRLQAAAAIGRGKRVSNSSAVGITMNYLFHSTILIGLGICVISMITKPPQRYPDLFPFANSAFCCLQFVVFLLYFYWSLLVSVFPSMQAKTKIQ